MEIIRSKTNKLIKQFKKLHQKKYRKSSYLIEGWHLVEEAVKAKATFEHILVVEEYVERVAHLPNVTVISSELMEDVTDSKTPQGIVAQLSMPSYTPPACLVGKFLVLEDVQDPGNVGTMIRTADAAGFDGVFLTNQSADIYNMKVLRSMQGSHFHLPIYRLPIEEIVARFKENEVDVLATTLSSRSIDYKAVQPRASFALIMGNEGSGISDFVAQESTHLVHITMPGQAESLNVAIATGILLFHFI